MTENPLAFRSIDTLGVRHRRDAYATLDAGSQPQRVHIKLARHAETGNLYSSQTTRNSEPRTRNRAARSRFVFPLRGEGRPPAYLNAYRQLPDIESRLKRPSNYFTTGPKRSTSSFHEVMIFAFVLRAL